MPAVSNNFTGMPSMFDTSDTTSRVVPGISVTIARSCSSNRLNKLLFPTFGRPTIASVSPCRTRPPYWKLSASCRIPARIESSRRKISAAGATLISSSAKSMPASSSAINSRN